MSAAVLTPLTPHGAFDRIIVGHTVKHTPTFAESVLGKIKRVVYALFQAVASLFQRASTVSYGLYYHFAKNTNLEPYYILSMDGGGVRGAIILEALRLLEEELGVAIVKAFDEIWGTSTGGIIALAASLSSQNDPTIPKFRISDIQNLYETMASKVFSTTLAYRLKSLWGARLTKYPSPEPVIHEIIGDVSMSASIAKKVAVTSVDSRTRKLVLFSNVAENGGNPDVVTISEGASVCKAACATASAPTYLPSVVQGEYNLIDGGVAANNPAALATYAAINGRAKDRQIIVLSLGTGATKRAPVRSKEPIDMGYLGWGAPINEYFLDESEVVANDQLKNLAKAMPDRFTYVRLQPILETAAEEALDDASQSNMANLKKLGNKCWLDFRNNQGGLASFITPLKNHIQAL